MITLPDSPIELAGFPVCKNSACMQEVPAKGDYCAGHGGVAPSTDILRRTCLRQIRYAVKAVLACPVCSEKPTVSNERCKRCCTFVGTAWGVGGLLERMGFGSDSALYLELVCVPIGSWM